MSWYCFDPEQCVLLVLSRDNSSTDSDYETLYQAYLALDEAAVSQGKTSLSFLLIEGSPPRANASWRKRFAELRLLLKAKRRLGVLVTDSMIMRGIMTVINWIQPKPENEEQLTASTFEEGVRWAEERRGPSREILERLLREARAKQHKVEAG